MPDQTVQIPLREAAFEMSQQALVAQTRSLDVEQWQRVGQALAALQRTDRSPAIAASRGMVLLNLHNATGSAIDDDAVDLIIDVLWAVHRLGGDSNSVMLDALSLFREEQRRVPNASTGPVGTVSADPTAVPPAPVVAVAAPQVDRQREARE